MFSFMKRSARLLVIGILFTLTVVAVACNPYSNKAGIGAKKIVAQVGDQKITFGEWMRQVDLYRVFAPQTVDPKDPNTVKEVLDSLVDQAVVMGAVKQQKYKNEEFEKDIKGEMEKARQELENIRERLETDLVSVKRLQKTYTTDYYNMRVAQVYAEEKVKDVIVTEKQKRDRYEQYRADAVKAGQKARSYQEVSGQIELRLKADNLLKNLQGDRKISREQDVIQKYLGTIAPVK